MDLTDIDTRIGALGFAEGPGREATAGERAKIVADLSPVDGLGWIGEGTRIAVFALPFHDGVDLVVASDPAWEPEAVLACWLGHGGLFWRLDGTSPPIHDLNGKVDAAIDGRNALSYLRFFCFFVRGAEGPFLVAEPASLPLVTEEARAAVAEKAVEPEYLGEDRNGALHAAATIVYGTAAFAARFKLLPSGMVEMVEDDPILDGLPGGVLAPLNLTGPVPD
jgi:hypothetical protein